MEKKTITLGGIEAAAAAANLDKSKEMPTKGAGFSLPEKTTEQLDAEEKELEAQFWGKVKTALLVFAAEYVSRLKNDGVDLTPSGEKEVIERIMAGFLTEDFKEEGEIEFSKDAVVFVKNSKGEKTTTFTEFLKDSEGVAVKKKDSSLLYRKY